MIAVTDAVHTAIQTVQSRMHTAAAAEQVPELCGYSPCEVLAYGVAQKL